MKITITRGGVIGLRAFLNKADLVPPGIEEVYRAGKLLDVVLPDYDEELKSLKLQKQLDDFALTPVDLELTEKQMKTVEATLKNAAAKQALTPSPHTNRLLEAFGIKFED